MNLSLGKIEAEGGRFKMARVIFFMAAFGGGLGLGAFLLTRQLTWSGLLVLGHSVLAIMLFLLGNRAAQQRTQDGMTCLLALLLFYLSGLCFSLALLSGSTRTFLD